MVVQHNLTAMNSNRMLGITTGSQAKSTEKLSSGYKINRAADDAAGLSISEKMRKQIRGLTQASLNAQDGISAVQTAEGALNEVQDMLQRMNELAVKAANGTMSEDDRGYVQDEIDQLVTEIDRVAETTKFNETYLLKGDKTTTSEVYSYANPDAIKLTDTSGSTVTLYDGCGSTLSNEAAKAMIESGAEVYTTITAGTTATTSSAVSSTHLKLTQDVYDANGHAVYKKGDIVEVGLTVAGLYKDAAGSASVTQATDIGATIYVAAATLYNADGSVAFEANAEVAATVASVTAAMAKYFTQAPSGTPAELGKDFLLTEGTLFDKDGNGVAANGLEAYYEDGEYQGGLYDSNGKAVSKDDIADYVSKSNTGIGSLSFKLHVGADATSNNQIALEIDAMDSTTLGIKDVSVESEEEALDTIETIKAAIQKVSTQRSALGAIQNRLEHTINNLDNVVENTTAAESQIRDTDMATEMVKYSNNNILAQAGQSMLAQANQANQGVLSLLG